MKSGIRRLRSIGLSLTLCALFTGIIATPGRVFAPLNSIILKNDVFAETGPSLDLIEEAWKKIDRVYVDRKAVDSHELTYGAISGMVEALGDAGHSTFLSPQMRKMQRDSTKGKFEGIGAEVQMKAGQLVIVAPIDGSPAQRAGLRPGDVILKVDGENIMGLPLVKAVEKILGHAGTSVILTILTPSSGSIRDMTIVRASVTVHNATWVQLPGTWIALVRIAGFSKGTTKELRAILKNVKERKLHGVVLDLRNNPGGLLGEAVGTASQFLAQGTVLLVKNAAGKITPMPAESGGLLPDLPLVVLVNQGTASGAEIVAGALHDNKRALLVGETTFGTGTVLEEFPLSDGSALLLAVQEWLTPDGHTIWHRGIGPDITVALPPQGLLLMPAVASGLTAEEVSKTSDTQVRKALEILEKGAWKR
jgi:carboxyl-terminal processing protease